jgi:hypothetical protein
MLSLQSRSARWFLAEVIVVVIGILLAIAIDAWWQERQMRSDEQEILAGLRSEFLAHHKTLTRNLAANLLGTQSLYDFLELQETRQPQATKQIVLDVLFDMSSPFTTDLGSGTLNALLGAGRLENLTSRKLRTQLAAWDGVFGEVRDDEANGSKMVFEMYIPHLVQQNYVWTEIEQGSGNTPVINRMLTDPTLRHLVTIRADTKVHLTGEFQQAIAAADDIILELEKSIK